MKRVVAGLLSIGLLSSAFAQSGAPVKQSGNITPGQVPWWITSGVVGGGVSSADSPVTSFGVTNNGGNGICVNSDRITAAGRNALCFGASTTGPATISLQNYGTATPQILNFNINGTLIPFPGGLLPGVTVGSTLVNNGTNGYFLYNSGGTLGNFNLFGTANTWTAAQIITANPATLPASLSGTLLQLGGNNNASAVGLIDAFGSSNTAFPAWDLRRARGSAAVPSAVQFLDNLGILGALGYGTTGYSAANAQVRFIAGENFTDTAQGEFISLFGTPAGSTGASITERFRSGANGAATPGAYNVSFGRLDILNSGTNISATASPDPLLVINQNTVALPTTVNGALEKIAFQIGGADGSPSNILIDSFGTGNTAAFSIYDFRRANGTAAAPTPLMSGDFIGVLGGLGKINTGYSGGAVQIRYLATQNWSDAAQGSALAIMTTLNGTVANTSVAERVRVDNTGFVGIGSNAPQSLLHLNGNTTQNVATQAGVLLQLSATDSTNGYIQIGTFGAALGQVSSLILRQAANTAASPAQVQSGAIIGTVAAQAYTNAGAYSTLNGQVRFIATENQTATAQGQAIAVVTTPNTTAAPAEAARFQAGGGFSVGTTADSGIGTALLKKQAFSVLTACSSTIQGAIANVTDSSTVTWGATITGGSTNPVLAFCDGTNWTVAAK